MNTQNKKNLLIAGGTGFIGKRFLKQAVENGYICHVITRSKYDNTESIKYYQCDLMNFDKNFVENKFNNTIFDGIVYMAANIPLMGAKKENYEDAMYSTLVPFVKFAQATIDLTQKFIYISSIDCVGIPPCKNYDEKVELQPFTPYAVAKLAGEEYIKSMAKTKNVSFSILRFSQVYGENEPIVRIIPLLIDRIKNNTEFSLYGTGLEKRRFLFVDDAANAIICALRSKKTGVYNIAGKSVESIKDLIDITEKVFNKKLNLKKVDYSGVTFDNIPSIEKASQEIGYEPSFSLQEGIERIYNAI